MCSYPHVAPRPVRRLGGAQVSGWKKRGRRLHLQTNGSQPRLQGAAQRATHFDPPAGEDRNRWMAPDLPEFSLPRERVVARQSPRLLPAQDPPQDALQRRRPVDAPLSARGHREQPVVAPQEALLEVLVGPLDRADAREPEFMHEPVLEGLPEPLDASLRLRAERRDPLDP